MKILIDDYTRLEEQETLFEKELYFLRIHKNLGSDYLGFGTVEIRISLRFDKKYFASYHFRFVIFSLF